MTQVMVTSPTSRVLVRGGGAPVSVGYSAGIDALKLRGIPIAAVQPAAGQALVYDGTEATWTDIATQVELDALTATVAANAAAAAAATATVASNLATHAARTDNPHAVTKAQVGLGNVEDTALSTWAGSATITTVGTLVAGAVPASLVTAGAFGAGEYSFDPVGVRLSQTDFSGGAANGALLTRGLTKVHSVDGSTNYSAQFGGIVAQVRGISNSAAGCSYTMARTRSPTEGTYTALVNNDHVGSFIWIAADGTDLATNVVRLRTEVAGSVSTSRVPGRFLIQVAAGATDDDIATRVTVTAAATTFAGNVLFGTDNTFDIGASGATRARDFFLARNAVLGGTLVVGASAIAAGAHIEANLATGSSTITPVIIRVRSTTSAANFLTGPANYWGAFSFYSDDATSPPGAATRARLAAFFEDAAGSKTGLALFVGPTGGPTVALTLNSDLSAQHAAGISLSGATAPSHGIQFGTSAPGTLADGQIWYDGTNLKARLGGATKTITVS